MWLSKADYKRLCDRIDKLEWEVTVEVPKGIYTRHLFVFFNGDCVGQPDHYELPIAQAVKKILDHLKLEFVYKPKVAGTPEAADLHKKPAQRGKK
jgi:hypothetical protein